MMRPDGRFENELRPLTITPRYLKHPRGSVLIEMGDTKVICAASVDEKVPGWMRGRGTGWVTGEYAMTPSSTPGRTEREATRGKVGGRTHEIQRLIGRSMRAVTDLSALGERTVWIDCDVIQADGGTRTASVTGGFVALALACESLKKDGKLQRLPLTDFIAAVSVGVVGGAPVLDLNYAEDSSAETDMNVVMTGAGRFVEVQGTAEREAFSREEMDAMLRLAEEGVRRLVAEQRKVLGIESFGK